MAAMGQHAGAMSQRIGAMAQRTGRLQRSRYTQRKAAARLQKWWRVWHRWRHTNPKEAVPASSTTEWAKSAQRRKTGALLGMCSALLSKSVSQCRAGIVLSVVLLEGDTMVVVAAIADAAALAASISQGGAQQRADEHCLDERKRRYPSLSTIIFDHSLAGVVAKEVFRFPGSDVPKKSCDNVD